MTALDPHEVTAWSVPRREPARARPQPDPHRRRRGAAGFPGALVAGVTTYAYLTHPVVAAWGDAWLRDGGGELRLRQPVFDGDTVECVPTVSGEDVLIEARTGAGPARATFTAVARSVPVELLRDGEKLRSRRIELTGELGGDYGWRAGDDLTIYRERGLVHPAVWPAIANQVVHVDVARGSWIHTRSTIRHHGVARAGATADVHATVVQRFERPSGERAILDVLIEVDGEVVATLEHEAIVALPGVARAT